ncbi:MAG: hypothetical protein Q8L48_20355 [Archangium sp.]|nr:hypothetical protein [Archangium sp.]
MRRTRFRAVLALMVGVAGCPRITPERIDVPDAGTCNASLCGTSVAVKTTLAPATPLTTEECERVCASAWCGAKPISPTGPGCTLESATSVACGSIAYDCGYCVFGCGGGGPGCGEGCCDGVSNCCRPAARSCRGLGCGSCPPIDPRCSLEGCRSFKACGGQLSAEPRASACGDARDAGIDLVEYCPDACNAMAAGAQLAAACGTDAGAAVDAGTHFPDGGVCDCEPKRDACERACSQSSVRTCLDCAAGCAIDFARCTTQCR